MFPPRESAGQHDEREHHTLHHRHDDDDDHKVMFWELLMKVYEAEGNERNRKGTESESERANTGIRETKRFGNMMKAKKSNAQIPSCCQQLILSSRTNITNILQVDGPAFAPIVGSRFISQVQELLSILCVDPLTHSLSHSTRMQDYERMFKREK
jgi:hypothetical protein